MFVVHICKTWICKTLKMWTRLPKWISAIEGWSMQRTRVFPSHPNWVTHAQNGSKRDTIRPAPSSLLESSILPQHVQIKTWASLGDGPGKYVEDWPEHVEHKRDFCLFYLLQLTHPLCHIGHAWATPCWRVPIRTKQLSTAAFWFWALIISGLANRSPVLKEMAVHFCGQFFDF